MDHFNTIIEWDEMDIEAVVSGWDMIISIQTKR